MIFTTLEIVAPIFILIFIGYLTAHLKIIDGKVGNGITKFAQQIALPCLLFINIAEINFSEASPIAMLWSYYIGASCCMLIGTSVAYFIFKLSPQDSVVLGFCALFSNALLLGLPITERAFGESNLAGNYSIIALQAPFCYLLGITVMELVSIEKSTFYQIFKKILKNIMSNALFIGIVLGVVFNLGNLTLPTSLLEPINLLATAAIPTALFGLGLVLHQYKLVNNVKEVLSISLISLFLHPALVYFFATNVYEVSEINLRSALITAAMAPGVNAYLFSVLYNRESPLVASTILFSTILAIFTSSAWILFLGAT